MHWILWFVVAAGHIGIWCFIFNRTHATAWPRGWRKLVEWLIILVTGLPLLVAPVVALYHREASPAYLADQSPWIAGYMILSVAACGFFFQSWVIRKMSYQPPAAIELLSTLRLNPAEELGKNLYASTTSRLLGRIPGNQSTSLAVETYKIDLTRPNFPQATIRIAQLSDLHFTGMVDREFFEFTVARATEFVPDLVFVTGDIVDEPDCIDWMDVVLGPLARAFPVFYILGNHDRRIENENLLRSAARRCGMIQAAGQWHRLRLRGSQILLTGNELPWYRVADQLPAVPDRVPGEVRLLLSHSPDQIEWACDRGIDMMFAGHTHGGQIRLPLIGPIIAPSKYGVEYASGNFRKRNTLMHVSRGLSGDDPVRILCPPELGLFELAVPVVGEIAGIDR